MNYGEFLNLPVYK